MNAPQRYSMPLELTPHEAGQLVRFADVEEAFRDSTMLDWLMPIVDGRDDQIANARTHAIAKVMVLNPGATGRDLVKQAMAWSAL